MDLSSMLNDGPAPERKPPSMTPPDIRQSAQQSVPSTPGANGGGYASNQPTPLYGPGAPLSRQTTGLTPLQTPSHAPASQYPFPQQQQHMAQSPAVQQASQQYQSYGPYSATTPSARPPSHGFQYPQQSPLQYQQPGMPAGLHSVQTTSLSPTPSSHRGQTPQSVRQSPLTTISHALPPQHQHQHYQLQHSQPGTPLGPPPLQYSRSSNLGYADTQSPYHQRHSSGTSNGITAHSPAQHHPSIGNLVDSPSAYNHHSPAQQHLRRTSDYLSQVNAERERSLSVSPKTKVLPRALSQSSRQSSQAEAYHYNASARSSLQHQQSLAAESAHEVQGHVLAHSHPPPPQSQQSVAHPEISHAHSSGAGDVAQRALMPSAQTPYSVTGAPAPAFDHSLSQQSQPQQSQQQFAQPPTTQQHHQAERLSMNQLLTPANAIAGMDGALDGSNGAQRPRKKQDPSPFMRPSPKPKRPAVAPPPPVVEDASGAAESRALAEKVEQQPAEVKMEPEAPQEPSLPAPNGDAKTSHKRAAESEPAEEPAVKRSRARKYDQRPPWARLHPKNPSYKAEKNGANGMAPLPRKPGQTNGAHAPHASQNAGRANGARAQQQQQHAHAQASGAVQPVADHYTPEGAVPGKPWSDPIPLDHDLLNARACLGLDKWEKSIKYVAPVPDMVKQVIDFLYEHLASLNDVPDDTDEVEIEIEAKIGRLLQAKAPEGERARISLPFLNPGVLHHGWARAETRFESQMEVHEHATMNKFLNSALMESRAEEPHGRAPISYSHPKSLDSFRPLSAAGWNALHPSFRRHARSRADLKLRTTTDTTTGTVQARIVKAKIADLHIFNPTGEYDVRISLNLEGNLNSAIPGGRPEDFADFSEDWKVTERASPDRMKDRMSYRHLVYRIDLTMVSAPPFKQADAKYELEMEVDAPVLREQMRRMQGGEDNAVVEVVTGFLDNAAFLMRLKAGGQ